MIGGGAEVVEVVRRQGRAAGWSGIWEDDRGFGTLGFGGIVMPGAGAAAECRAMRNLDRVCGLCVESAMERRVWRGTK